MVGLGIMGSVEEVQRAENAPGERRERCRGAKKHGGGVDGLLHYSFPQQG